MSLRETLKPCVQWNIGNGQFCGVFAQPWFRNALEFRPADENQRRLLVKDLLDT